VDAQTIPQKGKRRGDSGCCVALLAALWFVLPTTNHKAGWELRRVTFFLLERIKITSLPSRAHFSRLFLPGYFDQPETSNLKFSILKGFHMTFPVVNPFTRSSFQGKKTTQKA